MEDKIWLFLKVNEVQFWSWIFSVSLIYQFNSSQIVGIKMINELSSSFECIARMMSLILALPIFPQSHNCGNRPAHHISPHQTRVVFRSIR